jgi:hypothetical protein
MVQYENSVIYKICCKDPTITDNYIGSTCAFRKRKINHKLNCTNQDAKFYNHYVYQFIRENGGWPNWQMVVVNAYPDIASKKHLLKNKGSGCVY